MLSIVSAFVCAFLAMGAWALSSPVGSSPDEDYHLVSIWCGHGTNSSLCRTTGKDHIEVLAPKSLVESASCFAFHPEISGSCAPNTSLELVKTSRSNLDGGYPPIFYWTMNFLTGPDISNSVLKMRFFNICVFLILMGLSVRLVSSTLRKSLVIGPLVCLVPLGMFLIPSINPSSWAITSSIFLWILLTSYFQAETKKSKIVFIGLGSIALIIGAGSRSDSAIYSCLAILISIVMSWKEIKLNYLVLIPPFIFSTIAVFFFFSGHQSSVAIASNSVTSNTGTHSGILINVLTNLVLLPQLWAGAFGTWGLGWLDTAMPGIVWVTSLFIFAGAVFTGLRFVSKNKYPSLVILLFALISIPLYVLVISDENVGAGVQPRYIYPLLIMLAGLSLYMSKEQQLFNRGQETVIVLGLTVANSLALHTNLRRYVTGVDVNGVNLNDNIEWWWTGFVLSPMEVWAIGSISFGVVVWFCLGFLSQSSILNRNTSLKLVTELS